MSMPQIPKNEEIHWVQKFFEVLGYKLFFIILLIVAAAVLGIFYSFDRAKEEVVYYIIQEISKGVLITALITGLIKWYIHKQFTRELKLVEDIKETHLVKELELIKEIKESHLAKELELIEEIKNSRLSKELELIEEIKNTHLSKELEAIKKNIENQTKQITDYSISLGAMQKSGVTRFYENRKQAGKDINTAMKRALESKEGISKIKIIGISLNDFTRDEVHVLHDAWHEIQNYVKGLKQTKNDTKIEVKALVLDSLSKGGFLRANAERQKDMSTRLSEDVGKAIRDFEELEKISEKNSHIAFSSRLYRTSPILYMVWTPEIAFVQQYYFRPKHQADINIPVVRYIPKSGNQDFIIHQELESHFDWLWNTTSIGIKDYLHGQSIGTFEAISMANIENMFYNYPISRKRIINLIKTTEKSLYIKGISLHSYFHRDELTAGIIDACRRGVQVKILLLDPKCEQATIRSFREYKLHEEEATFEEFKANESIIQERRLFIDTNQSFRTLKILKKELQKYDADKNLIVKKYNSAPEAFMLISDSFAIIEQYHYGKIGKNSERIILGGDVPLVEFKKIPSNQKIKDPYRIYVDHFEFVFKHFSKLVK